ncbi:hypothetical protein [Streptococcus suis]|uniref:hypothetical protein n=1 Tax=Streptococcus suis TaxID=1307 RepID=UPI0015523AAB|nr:hypothetical protein [Streptococcus suis]MCK3889246.1 hypothetical protein [Streptococcus suis]NQM00656.1 hypothetical protein [Streptococcus suis]HEM4284745.1 hypothetical protein [Streptococcus suis]HEM6032449.1 hypothetical protein [Streptococcus suis]HEM6233708.1 hypothetical protein [Streptococcus suis]
MYEINLNQGGVDKVFKKDYVNVEDNLLAVEHQVRQAALYGNEKASLDPKRHRVLNEAYLQMFVDMYGKQFSVDDLKRADMSVLETLNDLYLEALGGKKEETEGEEPKEV